MNRELKSELRPDEEQGLEQVAMANENSIQIPLTEEKQKEAEKKKKDISSYLHKLVRLLVLP